MGISFIFGVDAWRHNRYPVATTAPCEGTSYEIGGIALVKGARNAEGARRYYDWLMSPQGQAIGAKANSLQSPPYCTFKPDHGIPSMDSVRLIKYDFGKLRLDGRTQAPAGALAEGSGVAAALKPAHQTRSAGHAPGAAPGPVP